MTKQTNINSVVTIAAVDYTSSVSACQVSPNVEELDTTTLADLARRREGGLKDGQVAITFKFDDDQTVKNTISGLLGTVVAVTWKPDNAAIAATNPELQFNALVTEAPPWGGEAGSLDEVSVTWPLDTVVTYDVTP